MWTRLFIYILLIVVIGGLWAGVSAYGNSEADMTKTDAALETVNGDDTDYADYQATRASYSHVQTYAPWVAILSFLLVTYLIWSKPIVDAFKKGKKIVEEA